MCFKLNRFSICTLYEVSAIRYYYSIVWIQFFIRKLVDLMYELCSHTVVDGATLGYSKMCYVSNHLTGTTNPLTIS